MSRLLALGPLVILAVGTLLMDPLTPQRSPVERRLLGKWHNDPRDGRMNWIDLHSDGSFQTWNTQWKLCPWQGSISSSTWRVQGELLILEQRGSVWPQAQYDFCSQLHWAWRNSLESLQPGGRQYGARVVQRYRIRSLTPTELQLAEFSLTTETEGPAAEPIILTRADPREALWYQEYLEELGRPINSRQDAPGSPDLLAAAPAE